MRLKIRKLFLAYSTRQGALTDGFAIETGAGAPNLQGRNPNARSAVPQGPGHMNTHFASPRRSAGGKSEYLRGAPPWDFAAWAVSGEEGNQATVALSDARPLLDNAPMPTVGLMAGGEFKIPAAMHRQCQVPTRGMAGRALSCFLEGCREDFSSRHGAMGLDRFSIRRRLTHLRQL